MTGPGCDMQLSESDRFLEVEVESGIREEPRGSYIKMQRAKIRSEQGKDQVREPWQK